MGVQLIWTDCDKPWTTLCLMCCPRDPISRPDIMDETVLSSILVGIGYLAARLWTKLAMSTVMGRIEFGLTRSLIMRGCCKPMQTFQDNFKTCSLANKIAKQAHASEIGS